jgi:hypothetical protein
VIPSLESTTTIAINFDLWMSKSGVDTFVLVINYLDEGWIPRHVIVGLFEVHKITRNAMALQL